MSALDLHEEVGPRAKERLEQEQVGWLTTVSPGGRPQPTPVWFLWSGGDIVVLSQPEARKLRNLAANPTAALHFHTDQHGGDVQVLSGPATVDPAGLSEQEQAAYDEKYRAGIASLGMTEESMRAEYSTVIRLRPTRLTGWR